MRIKIPLTGTVTGFDADCYKLDNIGISGDRNDPVRPVPIDLGGVAWHLISVDLETDMAEIEIEAPESIDELKSGGNPEKPEDYTNGKLTAPERQAILDNAETVSKSKAPDEFYTLTGAKKLIKAPGVMTAYRARSLGI